MVKASEVVEKMKQSDTVNDLFKIDFLAVTTNVLIRSNTNNFVTQSIILFDEAKVKAHSIASLFYTRLIFLLVS